MEKAKLSRFIQKYYLSGLVESVKWEISNNSLSTSFVSDDSSVVGTVKMNGFDSPNIVLPVYDTSKLNKLMSVLGNDVSIDYHSVEGRPVSIKFKDSGIKVNYALADVSVIPKVPTLKELPSFDVSVSLDDQFMTKFIKAIAALPEETTFTFEFKNGVGNIILGYSNINTNRISIDVDCDCGNHETVNPISFSAAYFKEILKANKEATDASLKISTSGLAYVQFSVEEYDASYYLVKVNS